MAAGAIGTELATMDIVTAMATGAGIGHLKFVAYRLRMAGLASKTFVGTVENKVGAGVVIKGPELPATGVVTVNAGRAQGAVVLIVFAMAVNALFRCFPEAL